METNTDLNRDNPTQNLPLKVNDAHEQPKVSDEDDTGYNLKSPIGNSTKRIPLSNSVHVGSLHLENDLTLTSIPDIEEINVDLNELDPVSIGHYQPGLVCPDNWVASKTLGNGCKR